MQDLRKIMEAYTDMVSEKKKLDPVDKKALSKDYDNRDDKDIDNDGDTDSSDEYLHKRRKAIKKNTETEKEVQDESSCGSKKKMKESEDEDDEYKDEKKGKGKKKDCDDDMEEGKYAKSKMKEAASPRHNPFSAHEFGGKNKAGDTKSQLKKDHEAAKKLGVSYKEYIFKHKYKKKMKKESTQVRHSAFGHGEVLEATDEGYNVMFEHGVEFAVDADDLHFFEGKTYDERTKGATPKEKWADKLKGKGAKDMAKDLDMTPDLVQDEEEGHDDVLDAARAVKSQSPTRGQEKRIGDKSAINKPNDFTNAGKAKKPKGTQ